MESEFIVGAAWLLSLKVTAALELWSLRVSLLCAFLPNKFGCVIVRNKILVYNTSLQNMYLCPSSVGMPLGKTQTHDPIRKVCFSEFIKPFHHLRRKHSSVFGDTRPSPFVCDFMVLLNWRQNQWPSFRLRIWMVVLSVDLSLGRILHWSAWQSLNHLSSHLPSRNQNWPP